MIASRSGVRSTETAAAAALAERLARSHQPGERGGTATRCRWCPSTAPSLAGSAGRAASSSRASTVSSLESDAREEITFTGWLTDMILRGVFEPLVEYAE